MNKDSLAVYPSEKLNYDIALSSFMPDKYSISSNFIQEQYFVQNKSQDQIAKELGVSQWVISQRMMEFGFKPKSNTRKIGIRKYSVNDNFFNELNSTTAWVLGWMASDGFVRINDNTFIFGLSLAKKDVRILEIMRELLKFNGKIYTKKTYLKETDKFYEQKTIKISSKKIVERLMQFGIVPNKTKKLSYPKIIEDLGSEDITKSFILGVFEGDGSIMYAKKYKSPCFQIVGTYEFMSGIQKNLVKYLGLKKTKLTHNSKLSNHYALRYNGKFQVPKIMDWLYNNSSYKLERKYVHYLKIKEMISG